MFKAAMDIPHGEIKACREFLYLEHYDVTYLSDFGIPIKLQPRKSDCIASMRIWTVFKQKAGAGIELTREQAVDKIVPISIIPATWTVSRVPTAYLVDLSDSRELLKVGHRTVAIDAFIRAEDQDSWGGSSGHAKGDANTAGFMPDLTKTIRCRRCPFKCNGISTCEFNSTCKSCNRNAKLSNYSSNGTQGVLYLKPPFIGCTKWIPAERFNHHYLPIPANMDLNTLQFVMQNNGHLPGSPLTVNETCPLTVHAGLEPLPIQPYILNGQIKSARIVKRKYPTEMIIFVPVDRSNHASQKALVVPRNPHNHPAHPKTKPSANDRRTLSKAAEATGVVGSMVQGLLNALSTSLIYDGEQVAAIAPAFMDHRRVRDFIDEQKKKDYPRGMG
ncbi:hypothetical protein DFH08DRAFT_1029726 [Mycena albidolilacea]|uniref:Uncharacterized protein n=1 Tax=Mycena albidolilacea TaxID=1033008 RepID=A0AAD6ZHM8_9AGAR|nr:hypothetical protein DFH08DRAFT_1029726 [Mycena albidolilacea]